MKWKKRGVIFCPNGLSNWARHSALQPTPLLINPSTIRLYLGFRDNDGRSRVGYVDVRADNPSLIVKVSENPCLDIGQPSAFDSDGVVPCAVIRRDDEIYLYYAGYLRGQKIRFKAFSGLAVSRDNGESFVRVSTLPVLPATKDESLFRVIHCIVIEGCTWKIWYGAGNVFQSGVSKSLPHYNIRYMASSNGVTFPEQGQVAIETREDEYRVGRPCVIKKFGRYLMFFGKGSEAMPYQLAFAESEDGISWTRKDDKLCLSLSTEGWDSEMMAYPAVVETNAGIWLFYNGNDYGRTGFGYAELLEW